MNSDAVIAVVLHFRTVAATAECLASLKLSGVRHTVLVDNSEDGGRSLAALSPYVDRLQAAGMATTVASPCTNLGFAGGVNAGVALALAGGAGRILLINSDARLAPDALPAMSLEMDVKGGGVVAPLILAPDGSPAEVLHYHALAAVVTRSAGLGSIEILSGACLLVDREVALRFPFDESFFFYCEDVDWSNRLARACVPSSRSASAIAFHAGAGSSRNGSLFYEYHTVRGHWLLASRLLRNPLLQSLGLLLRILTLGVRATIRCLRTGSLLPVRALCLATLDVARGRSVSLTPQPAASRVMEEDAQR